MVKKPGRPKAKERKTARQLGRVSDADWELICNAAEKSQVTRTRFILGAALRAARKVLAKA